MPSAKSTPRKSKIPFQIAKPVTPRLRKLIDNIAESGAAAESRHYVAVWDYLVQEGNCSSLELTLKPLDADLIPKMNGARVGRNIAAMAVFSDAFGALTDLVALIISLRSANASPAHASFQEKCFQILVERWSDITQWMGYLTAHRPTGLQIDQIPMVMASVLFTAFDNPIPWHQEIMHRPATVVYLLSLLQELDRRTGKYCYAVEGSNRCLIMAALSKYLLCADGRATLLSHIKASKPSTRRRIVTAIVERPMRIVGSVQADRANLVLAAADSVDVLCLFASKVAYDATLLPIFLRRNLWGELGSAVCALADMAAKGRSSDRAACWQVLARSIAAITGGIDLVVHGTSVDTASLGEMLCPFLEPGVLPRAVEGIKFLKGDPEALGWLSRSFQDVAPYCTISRIAQAALRCPAFGEEGWDMAHFTISRAVESGFSAFKARDGIAVNMCGNIKHLRPCESNHAGEYSSLRKCGSCESVVYCSLECQREDWDNGHRVECASLLKLGEGHKFTSPSTLEIRRDQLVYLEHLANKRLPPAFAQDGSLPAHPYTVALFNATRPDGITYDIQHRMDIHAQAIWGPIDGPWSERVGRCVLHAVKDPKSFTIVEGIFEFNFSVASYVLAEMRYDPDAPSPRKFSVVNSVFRQGPLSAVDELDLADETDLDLSSALDFEDSSDFE
ncbi:hypothetical protein D9611_005486 [Ephemerocybe angulata]|uniref:MYND-type domain-containing protein n=1 Tax=Ephemerocybe angulata TaxID=980116 RepID=A0A8H5C0R3_9AGAR|nr:hypothetical protein D9611_005486 [Tulosesus angulatus]